MEKNKGKGQEKRWEVALKGENEGRKQRRRKTGERGGRRQRRGNGGVVAAPSAERLRSRKYNRLVDDRKIYKEIKRKPRFGKWQSPTERSSQLRTGGVWG